MIPRSWLFVPGSSARMMQKALGSGADALILDLEDAVAPVDKAAARETVAAFLDTAPAIPCYIRVNALSTGMTETDVAAVRGKVTGFVLPKCEGARDLDALAALTGGAPVLAIATETVRAVRALQSEDWSHPTLLGLAWGPKTWPPTSAPRPIAGRTARISRPSSSPGMPCSTPPRLPG
ncbi:HpcH/HpaI aldolase/citrate lyase family protein [Seohaeicola zhoushanensis]